MYREIIIPSNEKHSIRLPKELYGKRVEVIAFAVEEERSLFISDKKNKPGKKNFLDDIEFITNFPGIEEIRKEAWPQ